MKNPILGGSYLISVIIIWVASSTTIHTVFSSYPKPYFLTYCTSSLFSLYLIPAILNSSIIQLCPSHLLSSLKFSPLWFLSNYFFNISLNLTSVSSNTILASTSGIFTLLFSILFLKDSSSLFKWAAVFMSFSGIICIGIAEDDTEKDNLVGDLFAVAGAALYAGYSVCLKTVNGEDLVSVFGCMGIVNFLLLGPGVFLVDLLGIEEFETPGWYQVELIAVNALVGSVVCDLFWARSVEHLTPTICTLGLSFTIPISMAADKYLEKSEFEYSYLIGVFLILTGFIIITLTDNTPSQSSKKELKSLLEEPEI